MPVMTDVTGPYDVNGTPLLSAAGPRRKSVQACSMSDPDLWLWESLHFKTVSARDLGQYTGLICNARQWKTRMRARGFSDPGTRYPTQVQ